MKCSPNSVLSFVNLGVKRVSRVVFFFCENKVESNMVENQNRLCIMALWVMDQKFNMANQTLWTRGLVFQTTFFRLVF